MKAEIIVIGDELLIGQTVDTNSAWMAEQLNLLGVEVRQITTIRDEEKHIVEELNRASSNVDLILITGGLGPTNDDITKETLCEYFGTELIFHEEIYNDIEKYFASRGLEMLPVNRLQAMLPASCEVLKNVRGTASGMLFREHGKIFVSMPGVPYEMKGIMNEHVLPMLTNEFVEDEIVHKTIKTIGIGESFLAEKIKDWEESLKRAGLKLAYLPSPGIVKLRLTSKEKKRNVAEDLINEKVEELNQLLPDYIFGYDKEELHEIIGELLIENKATIATAESCTGGNIAHLITSVAGSSDYYKGSIVSYANEIKINQLGVNEADLEEYGAVSEEVVKQMVLGVQKRMNVDYAIATSGIAGPSGGSEEKPVGTVWIAVAGKKHLIAKKFQFGNNRERNIHVSSITALNMIRKLIENEN